MQTKTYGDVLANPVDGETAIEDACVCRLALVQQADAVPEAEKPKTGRLARVLSSVSVVSGLLVSEGRVLGLSFPKNTPVVCVHGDEAAVLTDEVGEVVVRRL